MPIGREYYIYIMTNDHNTVIYSGVTNDLARRVYEHKNGMGGTFTSQHGICKLVYYEITENASAALGRDVQIKSSSEKKRELVISRNPAWKDLYEEVLS